MPGEAVIEPYTFKVEATSKDIIRQAFNKFMNSGHDRVLLLYNNSSIKRLLEDFISLFQYVEAAGGIVYNNSGDRLFIYRFGKWDFPKGKVEPHETIEEAALREVQEETGLKELELLEELPSTFHMFDYKGKRFLKRTYWYKMYYSGTETPVPQTEEDIEQAVWIGDSGIKYVLQNTYTSLKELINR